MLICGSALDSVVVSSVVVSSVVVVVVASVVVPRVVSVTEAAEVPLGLEPAEHALRLSITAPAITKLIIFFIVRSPVIGITL